MPLLIQLQILEDVFPGIIADIVLGSLVASATILNTGDKLYSCCYKPNHDTNTCDIPHAYNPDSGHSGTEEW